MTPVRALCTARALPMTGQRRASTCRFDIMPPLGDIPRVLVDNARRVVGDVLFRKGHMPVARAWDNRASMMPSRYCSKDQARKLDRRTFYFLLFVIVRKEKEQWRQKYRSQGQTNNGKQESGTCVALFPSVLSRQREIR